MTWHPASIGIIGGEGKMGSLFRVLFEARGLKVRVCGESSDPDYGGLVPASDVVIVTVPIMVTLEVIGRVAARMRPDQLLMDFTSIKREPVAAMLRSPAWVIGCHPLFGPMPNPTGQNVVVCPARPGPCLPWLQGFLATLGMKVVAMTPEAHDESMAFIQGLTHFLNIVFARTLESRQADLQTLLQVCSPVYQVFFAVLSRILSGNAELYGQIQSMNRENIPVLRSFMDNGQELLAIVEAKRWDEFYRVFDEAAAYLGPFKAIAREESDFLIEQMREYLEQRSRRDQS